MESLVVETSSKAHGSGANCTTDHLAGGHVSAGHLRAHQYVLENGSFIGHASPGVLVTIYGILWTYNTIQRYQVAVREAVLNGRNIKKLNFKCMLFSAYQDGFCALVPLEAMFLLFFTTLSLCGEIISAFIYGIFLFSSTHHLCMFFFFGLVCATKILMHYKHSLPAKSDVALFIVANLVEALLFSGHVTGRSPMNVQVHVLMVYTILATAVFASLELVYTHSVLASLGRNFSLTVYGLWLIVVAFILYPPSSNLPKWDQEDHAQMALITTLFVTAIAVVITVAFIMNQIITCKVKRLSLPAINRMQSMYYRQNPTCTPDGNFEKPLISDSDCEC